MSVSVVGRKYFFAFARIYESRKWVFRCLYRSENTIIAGDSSATNEENENNRKTKDILVWLFVAPCVPAVNAEAAFTKAMEKWSCKTTTRQNASLPHQRCSIVCQCAHTTDTIAIFTVPKFVPSEPNSADDHSVSRVWWPGARERDAKGGTLYFVRIILLSLASISNTLQFTRTNEQQLDITWTHIDVSGFRSMVVVGVHTLLTPCTQNKVYSLPRVQTQRPYSSQCNQKLGSVWSRAVNIQRQHQFFRCNLCRRTRSSASKSKCEVSIFTANEKHVYCMLKNFTRLCIWNDRCRQKRDKMANETTAKCSFISENTPTNPINI